MPLYEYQCDVCAHRFEVIQKFTDPPPAACPKCGAAVTKLMSSPAIQFKGSGFYLTDYGRSGSKGDAANEKGGKSEGGLSKGDSPSGEGKSAGGQSSDSKSSESKSDGKSSEGKASEGKSSESSTPGKSGGDSKSGSDSSAAKPSTAAKSD